VSNSGNQLLSRVTFAGFAGQLIVGALLGVVRSPCVGPTLGAATTLASRGKDLSQIAFLMQLFGLGAAAPLVLVGCLSRATMMRIRGGLLRVGKYGKQLFGLALLVLGVVIATRVDKSLETWILNRTPAWLTVDTTQY
jgi:cytochrome c-type biogenesis protein